MRDHGETPVVVRESARSELSAPRRTLLVLLGGAFLVVGLVDIALLWIPPDFESVTWEFDTLGRTLDSGSLPLSALGLALMAYGTTGRPRVRRSWVRVFGIAFGALVVLLALLAVLYLTALPTVLQQMELEAGEGLRRAALRHGIHSIVYTLAFGVIAVVLWRAGRSEP